MRSTDFVVLAALALLAPVSAAADPCTTPLARVGAVSAVHGFPEYYQDANALALQPCLDLTCDPGLVLPDPRAAVSFPDNFPDVFAYFATGARIEGPGALRARLELTLGGECLNGVPTPGQQIVVAGIRIRVSGVTRNATYVVTHPYGVDTLLADARGRIEFREETQATPLQFTLALGGRVGPFLRFVTGAVPPPPDTIGSPANDQTLTGSPCDQNFFRIAGSGLPGGGVETDQFESLIGRTLDVCGNGAVDVGEDCDDGNQTSGDCCSATCQSEDGGACNDGNACTTADTCAGT